MSAHGGASPPWAPGYVHRTSDLAPIGFRFRVEAEDFRVEELPERAPSGTGTHLWIEIEKRGISTREAARRLGRALGRRESEFGYAGRKDARAWTRQRLSIEHIRSCASASLRGTVSACACATSTPVRARG